VSAVVGPTVFFFNITTGYLSDHALTQGVKCEADLKQFGNRVG